MASPNGSARRRSIALRDVIENERRVSHTAGFPLDADKMLPEADVLLLVADGDGAMIFRYTANGEFGGDTWHGSVVLAEAQAVFEYGDSLLSWNDVPADIIDAHAYAVQRANERQSDRGGW